MPADSRSINRARRVINLIRLFRAGVVLVTAAVLYLMAAPSDAPGIADLSRLFGGSEITDAIGHVVLFSMLTFVWYFALLYRWNRRTAFRAAVAVVWLLGTGAELSQHIVPHRGFSLLDLLANWLGIGAFVLVRFRLCHCTTPPCQ